MYTYRQQLTYNTECNYKSTRSQTYIHNKKQNSTMTHTLFTLEYGTLTLGQGTLPSSVNTKTMKIRELTNP